MAKFKPENLLVNCFPELEKEYSSKNEIPFNKITRGQKKPDLYWKCLKNTLHPDYVMTCSGKIRGRKCPACAGKALTPDKALATLAPHLRLEWHPTLNTLSFDNVFANSARMAFWCCSACSHVWKALISNRYSCESGCPACVGKATTSLNSLQALVPQLVHLWHPTLNLPLTPDTITSRSSVVCWWQCDKGHPPWRTSPNSLTFGIGQGNRGCPYCSGRRVSEDNCLSTKNPELLKDWDYSKNTIKPGEVTYRSYKKVWWLCGIGHSWEAPIQSKTGGHECPYCCNTHTKLEQFTEQVLALPRFNQTILIGDKKYRPDLQLSNTTYLNVDGLYWHCALNKDRQYHYKLREDFESKGLRIIQFYEDEVYKKTAVIKSVVAAITGKITERVFARKCLLVSPTQEEADDFFEVNHLIGKVVYSKFIGLSFNNRLVSIMAYRLDKGAITITRFAGLLNVIVMGGFQKLLKQLVLMKPTQIETLIDLRYADGHSLEKAGFIRTKTTINYEYTDFKSRLDKRRFRVPAGTNETEEATKKGWHKLWNAGRAKYVLKLNPL